MVGCDHVHGKTIAGLNACVLGSDYWDIIFRWIPEWNDMVRKYTCKTEQHVYELTCLWLQMSM